MNGQRHTYHSIPLRTRRPAQQMTTEAHTPHPQTLQSHVSRAAMPAMPDEDQMHVTRATPTSVRRYIDTRGRDVRQQGNQRVVMKHVKTRPRIHWFFPVGLGMLAALALVAGGMWSFNAWNQHQLDSQYGFPRTWQTDQVVDQNNDSPAHKTHFTFENLNGHIFFVEIPAGDIAKAKIYAVITLLGDNPANWPVTAEFRDVNGDGHIDIVIHIQDQTIIYLNDGTGFKSQPPQQ